MSQSTKFLVNGQQYCTNQRISLLDLVNYFNYNDSLLVLEYNHLICNRKNWKKILIKNKDKIEIVTIVGGG